MNTPLNLIKTRTTRYTGEDGKERAVLFHEDYEQLIAAMTQFTQLGNAAAILWSGTFPGKLGGVVESGRALVKLELDASKPFLK